MKIYWSLEDVPELAPLIPAERKRVHAACLKQHFWNAPVTRWRLAAFSALVATPGLAILLMDWAAQGTGVTLSPWAQALGAAVGGLIGHWVFSCFAIGVLREHYPGYLQTEETHTSGASQV